jgi:hypothetical protein
VQGGGDIAERGDVQLLHGAAHHLADVAHGLTGQDRFLHQDGALVGR